MITYLCTGIIVGVTLYIIAMLTSLVAEVLSLLVD